MQLHTDKIARIGRGEKCGAVWGSGSGDRDQDRFARATARVKTLSSFVRLDSRWRLSLHKFVMATGSLSGGFLLAGLAPAFPGILCSGASTGRLRGVWH